MRRILHLYSDRKWTGPAELVVNLCRALAPEFDVTLIHERIQSKRTSLPRMAIEYGVNIHTPLRLQKHVTNPIRAWLDVRRLRTYIKKEGYRLIHVHRLPDHLVGGFASRRAGVPVLRTVHSEKLFEGVRANLLLSHFTNGLIVPTEKARSEALAHLHNGRVKVWVVPPAVDATRFDPGRISRESARSKLGIGIDEYVLALISRVRSERKVDTVVEAFGIAQEKMKHIRLIILGRGKRKNVEKCILEPVRRLQMENRVRHISYLSGESYVEALAAIDAGIYVAPGSDKSSRTVLELMAMGKPVIVGQNGVLSGLVDDEENGFVIETNTEKLAEAFVHLASDRFLSEKMGAISLTRVKDRFSLDLQASAVSKIYNLYLSVAMFIQSLLPVEQFGSIF